MKRRYKVCAIVDDEFIFESTYKHYESAKSRVDELLCWFNNSINYDFYSDEEWFVILVDRETLKTCIYDTKAINKRNLKEEH